MIDYKESQYTAPNTIVCISGNIKKDQIVEKLKRSFKKISASDFMRKEKVVESQKGPGLLLHYKKTDQAHFYLGARTYNVFHPDRYVLEVMSAMLGGMMSSRLFKEIRDRQGLAYYVSTDNESDTDTGYLAAKAGVDKERIDKAIITALKEFKKISSVKVSETEMKKAKENLKGKLSLGLESSDAKAFFYAAQELQEGKLSEPAEIFKRIDKVSANDILRVAKDIFRPDNLNLAVIGPFEDKERFKKLLKT
jgi:predicted Zn-dependent peptidase